MDSKNFDLYSGDEAEKLREMANEFKNTDFEKRLIELTDSQYEEMKPMQPTIRKGYMRNQPCVCGSEIKFKKCCWNYYNNRPLPVVETPAIVT